jgi:threonine synthase
VGGPGFRPPDNIITPCGAESNVLGCEIGFSELLRAEQIERLPRIFAAQPANCAPIAAAFMDAGEAAETVISPTMAEGTAIAHPIRMREVLGTLRETRGGAVTLTEREIAEATLDLARVGIFVEPTSAQVAAAFGKLLETGTITPEQTTVLVMTGTGLKATPRIAGLLGIAL